MSTEDELTERDKAVLGYTPDENPGTAATHSENGAESNPSCDHEERFQQLESTVETLQNELAETRRDLAQERKQKRELIQMVNNLQEQIEGDASLTGSTTLEKYTEIDEDDREELLSTSERRAVDIYENWDELAWTTQQKNLMETQARANAKNQPSKIKYRLEKHFDRSLQANEIYRAMKAVARLSGGEESTDTNGRTHVSGGDFEFHVLPTADNSGTRRVLERVGQ